METSNAYQSIYDGPAIDAAIARATEGGHIDAAIQAKPNRNLLDNWYFQGPVNQRGSGSYAVSGYTIDRWKTGSNKLTVNVTSDGITLINNDTAPLYFNQYIDGGIPVEDSYTISALVSTISGTAYFQTVYSDGAYGTPLNLAAGCNAITVSAAKTISRVLFQVNSGSSVTVNSAKLELGSQQTLAHQDADGNWVLNEIPDYGEQLARCQRYQIPWESYERVRATLVNTSNLDFLIPTPVTMRTKPVINTSVLKVCKLNGTDVDGFSFAVKESVDPGFVSVRATKNSHGLTDALLYVATRAIIDANL